MRYALASIATSALCLAACGGGGDGDPGTLEFRVYGEEYIEESIPADVFTDGWSVTFDLFELTIGDVTAQAGHDTDVITDATAQTIDISQGSGGAGFLVTGLAVPGGLYDHVGYAISDLAIQGSATDGTVTKTFDWVLPSTFTYSHCEVAHEIDGATIVVQPTIHGDHLFYDDAVSETPNVAFQALADADADADDVITLAELDAVNISGFERYQVGSLDIANLGDFVRHMASTVGHIDGEGHCDGVAITD
jgi:hypothetical protein